MQKIFILLAVFFSLNFKIWGQDLSVPTELTPLEINDIFVDNYTDSFSAKQISKDRLKIIQTNDVNRALKESPGVYVREEDGFGLRPNIGLRGTNPNRSSKVVILEDEILIGPAPYSAPAAYFTPSLLTTESLEVFKGFSSLIYGPNSVGGAVNYKSNSFNPLQKLTTDFQYGSFDTQTLKASLNANMDDYLVHLSIGRIETDGFRQIDSNTDVGFNQNVALLKIQKPFNLFNLDQVVELRFGYSDEDSNETYLGLTENDFIKKFDRRYLTSQLDQMKWQHHKFQIEHLMQINSESTLKTQIYHHDFQRTWYRLDGFRDDNITLRDVLNNPTGINEPYYNILTGASDSSSIGSLGDLNQVNNARKYYSQGLQVQSENKFEFSESLNSKIKTKLLLHQDEIRRKHDSDFYSVENQNLTRTQDARLATTRNSESAFAKSLSLQNENTYKEFNLALQMRYETVDFKFQDDLNSVNLKRSDNVFLPGLGVGYNLTDQLRIKYAMNKAATLAGLDANGTEDREESLNNEISIHFESQERFEQIEVLYFNNAYKNLTGTCTGSTGCTNSQLDQQFSGGKAEISGIEARASKGFKWNQFWIPLQINYTYLKAQFKNSFNSTSPEWGIGQVDFNDRLPYIPETQTTAIIGFEYKAFKQSVIINHYGQMVDQSVSENQLAIPSYGLIDYAAQYEFSKNLNFKFKVDNLLNKEYITSIRPFGYRAGKPQFFAIGLSYQF